MPIPVYIARIGYENTYDMRGIIANYLRPFPNQDMIISSHLAVQKYELCRKTLAMTIVLQLKLCKILLHTARICYENTSGIDIQ